MVGTASVRPLSINQGPRPAGQTGGRYRITSALEWFSYDENYAKLRTALPWEQYEINDNVHNLRL